jgi:hypothetical protein
MRFCKIDERYYIFVMSASLSFHMEKLGSHPKDIHTIWYLSIVRKYLEKLKFY